MTHNHDPLAPGLRRQVEELKGALAAEPTTAARAEARARVVWQWMNAAALAGRHAPQDLPLVCAMLLCRGAIDTFHADPFALFDRYVRELKVRDVQPDATTNWSSSSTPGAVKRPFAYA